jgi:predicted transposase/invertase (TIGR01784 family)
MQKIQSIHDKTFKQSMADIRVARDFFETYLPKEIHALVDLNTLKMSPNSYVNDHSEELSSDMLFEVKMHNINNIGFIYLLAEHQSTVDPLMAFRLWSYVFLILNDYIKKTNPKPKKLPMVFPLVFYHGQRPYNACRNLADLFQAPKNIVEKILFQDFCLIDTHDIEDEELRQQHWAGIMTYFFKHIYDREIWTLIQPLLEMMRKIESENGATHFLATLLKYWLVGAETTKRPQEFIEAIQEGLTIPIKGAVMTMGEQLINQGIQQGIQQGVQIGEGTLLMHQLQEKFSTIPQSYKQRIEQADAEMLLKWGARVLKAEALEEVFV